MVCGSLNAAGGKAGFQGGAVRGVQELGKTGYLEGRGPTSPWSRNQEEEQQGPCRDTPAAAHKATLPQAPGMCSGAVPLRRQEVPSARLHGPSPGPGRWQPPHGGPHPLRGHSRA